MSLLSTLFGGDKKTTTNSTTTAVQNTNNVSADAGSILAGDGTSIAVDNSEDYRYTDSRDMSTYLTTSEAYDITSNSNNLLSTYDVSADVTNTTTTTNSNNTSDNRDQSIDARVWSQTTNSLTNTLTDNTENTLNQYDYRNLSSNSHVYDSRDLSTSSIINDSRNLSTSNLLNDSRNLSSNTNNNTTNSTDARSWSEVNYEVVPDSVRQSLDLAESVDTRRSADYRFGVDAAYNNSLAFFNTSATALRDSYGDFTEVLADNTVRTLNAVESANRNDGQAILDTVNQYGKYAALLIGGVILIGLFRRA